MVTNIPKSIRIKIVGDRLAERQCPVPSPLRPRLDTRPAWVYVGRVFNTLAVHSGFCEFSSFSSTKEKG